MFTGLAGVYVAELSEKTDNPTYSNGFQLGEGMAVTIAPQYAEGSVYGDNHRVKYKKKFKNANITLGTTRIPKQAEPVMFGKTEDSGGEVVSNQRDDGKYVGFGCYATEEGGPGEDTKYSAVWIYKVKFADPGDDFETEGENITFKTPSLTGSAEPLKHGDWKVKKQFDAEEEAINWIKTKAGIVTGNSGGVGEE